MQPQYKSGWDAVALTLAAMVDSIVLEIIVLGVSGRKWNAPRVGMCIE